MKRILIALAAALAAVTMTAAPALASTSAPAAMYRSGCVRELVGNPYGRGVIVAERCTEVVSPGRSAEVLVEGRGEIADASYMAMGPRGSREYLLGGGMAPRAYFLSTTVWTDVMTFTWMGSGMPLVEVLR